MPSACRRTSTSSSSRARSPARSRRTTSSTCRLRGKRAPSSAPISGSRRDGPRQACRTDASLKHDLDRGGRARDVRARSRRADPLSARRRRHRRRCSIHRPPRARAAHHRSVASRFWKIVAARLSVDDIAHIYLELMDRLGLTRTDVVGLSIGGWIAADLATKVPERLERLVLIGPVGVKPGPPDKLDVPDVFAMSQDKLDRLRFHDLAKNPVDLASMPEEELHILARNRETLALLTWEPYMHNPKLKHRLHRVSVPTLFLRGASDGIVSAEYLERYAALIPQARTETIAEAGPRRGVEPPPEQGESVWIFVEGPRGAKGPESSEGGGGISEKVLP